MKRILFAVFFCISFCQFQCSDNSEDSSEPIIKIASISPTSGKANTTVEITGTGFEPSTSGNTVTFNGKSAVIASATNTSLIVQVPSKAGTGQVTVSARKQTVAGPEFKYIPAATVSTLAGSTSGYLDDTGTAAKFKWIGNLYMDGSGNIYVPDRSDQRIRKVTPTGEVTTVAGSGVGGHWDGPATEAEFSSPSGIVIDKAGNLFVTDLTYNFIRKITPNGMVSTFAGSGFNSWVDGVGAQAGFNNPIDIEIDANDNLYIVDQQNNAIRKVTPEAVVTTFSGQPHKTGDPEFMDGGSTVARFSLPSSIERDPSGFLL